MTQTTSKAAYTVGEFADLSGLPATTIRQHMDSGAIDEMPPLGKTRLIPAAWVDAWCNGRRVRTLPAPQGGTL